jgi:molybdenum cofactor biosynthesis protein B
VTSLTDADLAVAAATAGGAEVRGRYGRPVTRHAKEGTDFATSADLASEEAIRAVLAEASAAGARAVLFNGGTGVGRRDSTVETLRALFEKELPGFGEIFRMLSFKDIGSAAMMSRATAGTNRGMIVFAMPGSPQAVKLALRELILPELGHVVRELTR